MADWPLIAARLALYGDLGLLFGLPLFMLYGWRGVLPRGVSRACALLAALGIAISLIGFALLVAGMTGTGLMAIDPAMARLLVMQTAVGWAFAARVLALLIALAIALLLPERATKPALLALCGGTAVATLAWSGHGAADAGGATKVHLAADIVHLLSASAWIGALVPLLALVSSRKPATPERIAAAHAALRGFSGVGSLIVALIVATGVANIAFITGLDRLPLLLTSDYGRLLILKLLLFMGMLACAALNRWRLTPRLAANEGTGAQALASLRRCVGLELLLAALILGLIAWLGTLEPA